MMDHSLFLAVVDVYAAAKTSEEKSQKQVTFIVYIWRLQVYHVCINLLLQRQNANAEECSRRRQSVEKKNMSLT
jgi:hypothetical protein